MKFDVQAFNNLSYTKRTVFLCGKQIRVQVRPWNIPQLRKAAPYIKSFFDFFLDQQSEKELSPKIFLDFFFKNIEEVWDIIFITLDRSNQKCHQIDEKGIEIKAFEGFEKDVLESMLDVSDQVAIVTAIYHLMIEPIFEMLKAGGEEAKSAKNMLGEKKIVVASEIQETLRIASKTAG